MAMTPIPVGSGNPIVAQVRGAVSHVLRMGNQPALRRALPAILILSVAVLAVGGWLILREPARMVLFPGMAEADKAQVVEALGAAGIAAAVDGVTGEIEVATGDYHRARMQLAAQGLPTSTPDANAVLTDLPMGASRSVEGARLRQAQELDLARSITEISSVSQARVHLALPEKSAFLRDTQPPRASVFLQLAPGRMLEPSQVEAIVNLVSTSVPGMARGDVTVVDQMGRLLSRGSDDPAAVVSDRQLQHRLEVEALYRERIEALLTPIAGPGNLSVQVTVDMDFTQSQITEERVDPNGTALRSEQSELVESSEPPARGVPGAVANQPPNAAELQAAGEVAGEGATPGEGQPLAGAITNRSTGTTRNYEVSRTVETTQPASARVMKISAAILLRATPQAPAEEGAEPPPLLPEALRADLERLAQTAIGFDAARGDTITIAAQPFMDAVVMEAPADLSWLPEVLRQLGIIALVAIVALGIIRPLLTRVALTGEAAAAGGGGVQVGGVPGVEVSDGDSLDDVQARLEARRAKLTNAALGANVSREEKFAVLRQIVAEDPARIASVLQKMMKDDPNVPTDA